jgi:hypothetical protein
MNVSPQQQQEALAGKPVHLRDPETNSEFVLLRADMYNRVKSVVEEEEFDPSIGYEAFREAAGDEWNDPALDVYEQYRKQP